MTYFLTDLEFLRLHCLNPFQLMPCGHCRSNSREHWALYFMPFPIAAICYIRGEWNAFSSHDMIFKSRLLLSRNFSVHAIRYLLIKRQKSISDCLHRLPRRSSPIIWEIWQKPYFSSHSYFFQTTRNKQWRIVKKLCLKGSCSYIMSNGPSSYL